MAQAKEKSKEIVAQFRDVAPEPIPQLCGNCAHWMQSNMIPSFGQCALSAKGLPAPLVTLDKASCSGWASNGR